MWRLNARFCYHCRGSVCAQLRHDLSSSMFHISEPGDNTTTSFSLNESNQTTSEVVIPDGSSNTESTTNKSIVDVVATFSPRPRAGIIPIKLLFTTWVITIMAVDITQAENPDFWLAYLTYQCWVITCTYFACSSVLSIYLAFKSRGEENGEKVLSVLKRWPGFFVKATWALFSIALPTEIVIFLLYWTLIYEGVTTYRGVMFHGGGIILLLIDGFLISRIPLRIKQFILFECYALFYFAWSSIQAFSGMGNPDRNEGVDDDDAIYSSIKWKNDTESVLILSAVALLVINPLVFFICWCVSWITPKRLVVGGIDVGDVDDDLWVERK
mmetsp:Transcript_17171/g.35844  ORF Transcript_17171/g.35844 Transcript_17171/m.35844 type:complete len:327 (-) Transcript_17171:223-1203(-)